MVDITQLRPLSLDPTIGTTLNEPLPLDAPQQQTIGGPADVLPEERASGFRNFVERVGLTGPSLLNSLSLAFGQSSQEIENRRRLTRRRELEDQIFEKQAAAALAAPAARAKRETFRDVGGRVRDTQTGELIAPGAEGPAAKVSAIQEKVNLLVSAGVDENTAKGIAANQFVSSRDPVTGNAVIIDKATGRVVDGQAAAAPAEGLVPTPPEAPTPDVSEALGAGAVAKTAVNKIVDLFGGSLPFEETSVAASQLSNLNNETIQLLRAGLGGRPNVQLQRRVEKLLVEPNEIFGGEQEAKNKFQALISTIDGEASRLQNDINVGGMRPVTLDKARSRLSELQSLSRKFSDILASQTPQDRGDINRFFR